MLFEHLEQTHDTQLAIAVRHGKAITCCVLANTSDVQLQHTAVI